VESNVLCSFCGKKATNLETHLSRFHKEEFQLVETQAAEKEETSSNVSSCKRFTLDTQPELATLMSCFSRTETNRLYAVNSAECNCCLHGSIADYMIVDIGCPLNFVSQRPFMQFCKSLDDKFSVPRLLITFSVLHFSASDSQKMLKLLADYLTVSNVT
jgi:hypothetical protein